MIKRIAIEIESHLNFGDQKIAFIKSAASDSIKENDVSIFDNIMKELFIKNFSMFNDKSRLFDKEGPLLLDGPTGSGKSMTADLIAVMQGKKIIKVNIASLTEQLLEIRLRGYKKGAFTGADSNEKGCFEEAHNGILFLDEFQNSSTAFQTQLLDIFDPLSNYVYVNKVGDNFKKKFNVKVIIATNKPICALVKEGVIRDDLFYRVRDIIKIDSLHKIMTEAGDKHLFVKKYITLYRWKHAPYFNRSGDKNCIKSETECRALFPVVDESDGPLIDLLIKFKWPGNWRQFERIIANIIWENDTECRLNIDYKINQKVILRHLEDECKRLDIDSRTLEVDEICKSPETLRRLENMLRKNNFIINKTLDDLKKDDCMRGLTSRPSMINFLTENADFLSDDIRHNKKVIKILQRKNAIPSYDD